RCLYRSRQPHAGGQSRRWRALRTAGSWIAAPRRQQPTVAFARQKHNLISHRNMSLYIVCNVAVHDVASKTRTRDWIQNLAVVSCNLQYELIQSSATSTSARTFRRWGGNGVIRGVAECVRWRICCQQRASLAILRVVAQQ